MKYIRRIILFLISLFAMLCAFSLFASAAQGHQFVLTLTEPADCVSEGAEIYTCTDCGMTKTETIPALGHDFAPVWTVDREPTCLTLGEKSRHCTRCDARTDLLAIQTTRHNYTKTVIAPTCTEQGYTHWYCNICKTERDDTYTPALGHDPDRWITDKEPTCEHVGMRHRDCLRCKETVEQAPIPANGHIYTETVVEPTCTAPGYTQHTCRACGDTYQTKPTKATGHLFVSTGIIVSAPTCTEKGSETVRCSNCGTTETKTVPALGHEYSASWTIDKAASCTAKGEKSHHCTRCGARKDVTSIDRTAHTPVQDITTPPTCTAAGKSAGTHCGVCGKTLESAAVVPALGHNYVTVKTIKAATCTAKGSEEQTCSRCGSTVSKTTPALGHNYSSSWTIDKAATCKTQGEQSHHCTRCGVRKDVTVIERAAHTPVQDITTPPTCTTAGKSAGTHCSVCGKELEDAAVVPALGHDYIPVNVLTAATCTTKGLAEMQCSRCKLTVTREMPALGHDYSSEWTIDKAATCTAKGEQSHHCSRCGARRDVTAIDRAAHKAVKDKAVAPTCTAAGKTAGKHCSVCGKVLKAQSSVPATGHNKEERLSPATFDKAGKRVSVCTTCQTVFSRETIPALRSIRLSATSFVYDGKVKSPTVSATAAGGKALRNGKDYRVKLAAGRKKIGVYGVKVVFCGNYKGSKTLKFRIVPKQPTGISVSATETAVSLSWNKVPGATGYFVYRCDGKSTTRIAVTANSFFRVKKLKPGTAYTFMIRAYTRVGKDILWSVDSSHKTAATLPKTPNLQLRGAGRTVRLQWNNCGKNCVYEIWYADQKTGPFVCLGKTSKTTFAATDCPRGSTPCFKIKASVVSGGTTLCAVTSDVKSISM